MGYTGIGLGDGGDGVLIVVLNERQIRYLNTKTYG
jgi:hypothetical protein